MYTRTHFHSINAHIALNLSIQAFSLKVSLYIYLVYSKAQTNNRYNIRKHSIQIVNSITEYSHVRNINKMRWREVLVISITRLQEVRNAIQSLTVPAQSSSSFASAATHLAMFGDLLI